MYTHRAVLFNSVVNIKSKENHIIPQTIREERANQNDYNMAPKQVIKLSGNTCE